MFFFWLFMILVNFYLFVLYLIHFLLLPRSIFSPLTTMSSLFFTKEIAIHICVHLLVNLGAPIRKPSIASIDIRAKITKIFNIHQEEDSQMNNIKYVIYFYISIYLVLFYKKYCPLICRSGYKRQKCKNMEMSISWRLFKIEV